MNLWQRITSTFRRNTESQLDAELRAHLDALTDENIRAGMTADEARRRALLELGGVDQVKEYCRDERRGAFLDTVGQDLRYALRQLRHNPGFAAVAILTLALGVGANTAIFSFVNGVLLRPLPFTEPDRIVAVWEWNLKRNTTAPFSPPDFADFRGQARSFSHFGALHTSNVVLTGGEPERLLATYVTTGVLETLDLRVQFGRRFTAEDERFGAQPVVLLSDALWRRRFAAARDVVGRTIQLNDRPHTIIGVLPATANYPETRQVWLPVILEPGEMQQRASRYLEVVARLAPGVTLAQAQSEVQAIARRFAEQYPDSNQHIGATVTPLHRYMVREVRHGLLLLLGAAGFVLLIACTNVANLLLARATARNRELAVRVSLGASPGRLLRQVLTEATLLALIAGALGFAAAFWGMDAIRAVSPEVPRLEEVRADWGVFLFSMGIAALSGMLFGLLPAWRASRCSPHDALKESANSGGPGSRVRAALVVGEVAMSMVLLAGASLMVRTLWRVMHADTGFDSQNVLTAVLPRPNSTDPLKNRAFVEQLLARVRELPQVQSAGITTHFPLSGSNHNYGFQIEGRPEPADGFSANFRSVSPDFLRTIQVPLLAGRMIEERDAAGTPEVALVNQAMARRFWPGQNPIGRRIRIARGQQPAWRQIVGIVGSVRHEGLHLDPLPEMYVPYAQQPTPFIRLAVRVAGEPMQLASAVRQAVWDVDKDQPVTRIRPMTAILTESASETRFYSLLLGSFSALALLLAAIGIYGVMNYSVTRRTREIGIRMALGATRGNVSRWVLRHALAMIACGVAIGLAGATALTRLLEKLLLGAASIDPLAFAVAALLLFAVGVAACLLPARRAARVDPMVALRYE